MNQLRRVLLINPTFRIHLSTICGVLSSSNIDKRRFLAEISPVSRNKTDDLAENVLIACQSECLIYREFGIVSIMLYHIKDNDMEFMNKCACHIKTDRHSLNK